MRSSGGFRIPQRSGAAAYYSVCYSNAAVFSGSSGLQRKARRADFDSSGSPQRNAASPCQGEDRDHLRGAAGRSVGSSCRGSSWRRLSRSPPTVLPLSRVFDGQSRARAVTRCGALTRCSAGQHACPGAPSAGFEPAHMAPETITRSPHRARGDRARTRGPSTGGHWPSRAYARSMTAQGATP
jgi:hypothetical protein